MPIHMAFMPALKAVLFMKLFVHKTLSAIKTTAKLFYSKCYSHDNLKHTVHIECCSSVVPCFEKDKCVQAMHAELHRR